MLVFRVDTPDSIFVVANGFAVGISLLARTIRLSAVFPPGTLFYTLIADKRLPVGLLTLQSSWAMDVLVCFVRKPKRAGGKKIDINQVAEVSQA